MKFEAPNLDSRTFSSDEASSRIDFYHKTDIEIDSKSIPHLHLDPLNPYSFTIVEKIVPLENLD